MTAENARDPLAKMQLWLLREGILDEEGINRLEQKVDEEVQRAADRALQAVLPSVAREAILRHSVLGGAEADGRAVRYAAGGDGGRERTDDGGADEPLPEGRDAARRAGGGVRRGCGGRDAR